MIKLTQSLNKWLFDNHKEILPLIILGHLELFTEEMQEEYLQWCKSEEGRKYLVGGQYYKGDE